MRNHKAPVNDAMWEAAVRNFGIIGVGSRFLMEIELSVFDDSIFGEYFGIIVQKRRR